MKKTLFAIAVVLCHFLACETQDHPTADIPEPIQQQTTENETLAVQLSAMEADLNYRVYSCSLQLANIKTKQTKRRPVEARTATFPIHEKPNKQSFPHNY